MGSKVNRENQLFKTDVKYFSNEVICSPEEMKAMIYLVPPILDQAKETLKFKTELDKQKIQSNERIALRYLDSCDKDLANPANSPEERQCIREERKASRLKQFLGNRIDKIIDKAAICIIVAMVIEFLKTFFKSKKPQE